MCDDLERGRTAKIRLDLWVDVDADELDRVGLREMPPGERMELVAEDLCHRVVEAVPGILPGRVLLGAQYAFAGVYVVSNPYDPALMPDWNNPGADDWDAA